MQVSVAIRESSQHTSTMTNLATPINSKRTVKPEWAKKSRNALIDAFGDAIGCAIYYGLKQKKDVTIMHTRYCVSFVELKKISYTEGCELCVHFDFANLKVSQISVAGRLEL